MNPYVAQTLWKSIMWDRGIDAGCIAEAKLISLESNGYIEHKILWKSMIRGQDHFRRYFRRSHFNNVQLPLPREQILSRKRKKGAYTSVRITAIY